MAKISLNLTGHNKCKQDIYKKADAEYDVYENTLLKNCAENDTI